MRSLKQWISFNERAVKGPYSTVDWWRRGRLKRSIPEFLSGEKDAKDEIECWVWLNAD